MRAGLSEVRMRRKILAALFWSAYGLLAGVLIWHSCRTGESSVGDSSAVGEWLEPFFSGLIPDPTGAGRPIDVWWSGYGAFIRKGIGHFGGFGALGAFGGAAFALSFFRGGAKKPYLSALRAFAFCLASGLFLGALTEGLQLFSEGRNGSFSDVALDFSGYAVGAAASYFLTIFILSKRKGR